eukprot:TRINITY_DN45539_c0_g1_i1.p1 TRINITY_DN45539_c0_g1~~TRINITY_DN45539_c0_g1_i1.p1  ORF type:complete len:145 (-),score=8.89 TRINITY_DN45539_c0_g1_i1:394-828(-)
MFSVSPDGKPIYSQFGDTANDNASWRGILSTQSPYAPPETTHKAPKNNSVRGYGAPWAGYGWYDNSHARETPSVHPASAPDVSLRRQALRSKGHEVITKTQHGGGSQRSPDPVEMPMPKLNLWTGSETSSEPPAEQLSYRVETI